MPNQDEIMQQIFKLVSDGATMPLTSEMEATLHDRYYDWIVKTKDGAASSPQEIWDAREGHRIQRKFREIGEHLAAAKAPEKSLLGKEDCKASCRMIERLSDCPHCPDPSF